MYALLNYCRNTNPACKFPRYTKCRRNILADNHSYLAAGFNNINKTSLDCINVHYSRIILIEITLHVLVKSALNCPVRQYGNVHILATTKKSLLKNSSVQIMHALVFLLTHSVHCKQIKSVP